MAETPRIKCPKCGGKCSRAIVDVAVRIPADWSWSGENKGRGRYIGGLGKRSDPDAYCTSVRQAEDRAKSKGLKYELG